MSDRPLLQGLIDAAVASGQRHLMIPPGEYVVDRAGSAWWCLQVPPEAVGLRVHGAGVGQTVIRMASGSAPSTRILAVRGADSSVDSLSLEGGEQADADEHRAGIFTMAPRVRLFDIRASGFTGDGIYLYAGADGATIERCVCSGNLRNGITLGSTLDGVSVRGSQFVGNGAQQFDTEPGVGGVVSRLLVSDCLMDAQGASHDYVLTLGGSSTAAPGHDVTVLDCVLNGPTLVVWGDRVTISDCGGDNPTAKPGLTVYRTCHDVEVARCSFRSSVASAGVQIVGTGSGSCPDRVTLRDTEVAVGSGSFGVYMSSVMGVELSRCAVSWTGSQPSPASAVGVSVRATNVTQDARIVTIDSCQVSGFGGHGIRVAGNVAVDASGSRTYAHLERLGVSRTSVSGSSHGMTPDDGSGVVRVLQLGPGNDFGVVGVSPATRVVVAD